MPAPTGSMQLSLPSAFQVRLEGRCEKGRGSVLSTGCEAVLIPPLDRGDLFRRQGPVFVGQVSAEYSSRAPKISTSRTERSCAVCPSSVVIGSTETSRLMVSCCCLLVTPGCLPASAVVKKPER